MLKNFNNLIKNIVFESVNLDEINEADEKRVREVYNCNEFYYRYLADRPENVQITKQRQNTFLVTGFLKEIEKFFKNFKIDEAFMENPSDFKIYSPQFIFLENAQDIHYMGRGEMWPKQDYDIPSTHDIDNSPGVRSTIFGKWFSFYEENSDKRIKGVKPSDLLKNFKKLRKETVNSFNDDSIIAVEFSVNCEQWKNQIFDEMSEYSDIEAREDVNRNDDDFDYSLAALPKHSAEDEKIAKESLKDIKRSVKKYKENKR